LADEEHIEEVEAEVSDNEKNDESGE